MIPKCLQKRGVCTFVLAGIITIVHFVISVLLGAITSMDGLCPAHDDSDIEGCPPPNPKFDILRLVVKILYFPILYFPVWYFIDLSKDWEMMRIIFLNSCLWGFGIVFFISKLANRWAKK
jgi:hypothetical protein